MGRKKIGDRRGGRRSTTWTSEQATQLNKSRIGGPGRKGVLNKMTPLKRLGLGSVRDLAQAVFTPAWEKKFLKDCEKGKRRDIEMYLFMQLFGKPSDTLKVQNADGSAFLGGLDNLAQTLQDRLRPVIPAQIVEGLPPLILPLPPSPPKRPSKNGAGPQSNAMEQP